jgi:hypothetical protein
MAGCPKCSVDLVRANPHKKTITYPNGFVSFRELRAGEKLNLPDKWFDGTLDRLPKSYFAALPYADGVTPGKKMGVGLAAPYSEALVAAARAADAAIGADDNYCASVARVGTPVNTAVHNFKLAWNATESPKVPINTGNYELATGDALYKVLGEAFEPCAARAATTPRATTRTVIAPVLEPKKEGLSTGEIVGVSLLGAGAVGGVVYFATKPRRRR